MISVGQTFNRCDLSSVTLCMHTIPTFLSTEAMRLFAPGFNSLLPMIFSAASMTPSLHLIPIAVFPLSTALTAYSTWKRELLAS